MADFANIALFVYYRKAYVCQLFLYLLVYCLLYPSLSFAEDEEDLANEKLRQEITTMGFESLLNLDIEVNVASKVDTPLRTSSGIVTVIKAEEIRNLGARDLIDVLSMVPGIQFGLDINGQIGTASRGLWAYEGRTLLLLDGIQLSSIAFGAAPINNHIPIESIQRIEVIRGPGSVMHGGNAELLVISIITKKAEELQGASLTSKYSVFANKSKFELDKYGHRATTASVGYEKDGSSIVAHVGVSEVRPSDGVYLSTMGESLDLTNNYKNRNINLNIGAQIKDLNFRFIHDTHRTDERTGYGDSILSDIFPPIINESGNTTIATNYDWELIKDKLTVTPNFLYSHQIENGKRPGELDRIYEVDPESEFLYDIPMSLYEYSGGVDVRYKTIDWVKVIAGTRSFFQKFNVMQDPLELSLNSRRMPYWMSGNAGYGEVLFDTKIGILSSGIRYDAIKYRDMVREAIVPRASFATNLDWMHLKFLYAKAFRSPNLIHMVERLYTDQILSQEITSSVEVELGGKIGNSGYLTLVLFDTNLRNPITYEYISQEDVTDEVIGGLFNYNGSLGSRGFELDYKAIVPWGSIATSYSYYRPSGVSIVAHFMNQEDTSRYLAFAQHTFSMRTTLEYAEIKLTPSLLSLSDISAITGIIEDGSYLYSNINPRFIFNTNMTVDRLWSFAGLSFSIGVYNLFNDSCYFVQPHNAGHSPLPSLSREIMLGMRYVY